MTAPMTNEELLKLEPTQRGFMRAEFKDLYGNACSIQESSLATDNCIWLGCEHETVATNGDKCGARMHLTQTMARELSALLLHFAENGDLRPATITSLQSDLQRTREALEKAYPLCIGWAAHWKCDHGNFAPEHLETLDDCAKALGLNILPSKALTPPTGDVGP